MSQIKFHPSSLKRIENFVGNPAWEEFVEWCSHKKLNAVPANAWTLAAYIRTREGIEPLSKIKKRIIDIGKAHAEKSKRRPERDPLVAKTFNILEIQAKKQKKSAVAFDDEALKTGKPTRTKPKDTAPKSSKTRIMRSKPKLVSKRAAKKT